MPFVGVKGYIVMVMSRVNLNEVSARSECNDWGEFNKE